MWCVRRRGSTTYDRIVDVRGIRSPLLSFMVSSTRPANKSIVDARMYLITHVITHVIIWSTSRLSVTGLRFEESSSI